MGRPRKNGVRVSFCMDSDVYAMLEAHCDRTGQTKTTAVERAIKHYVQQFSAGQSGGPGLSQPSSDGGWVVDSEVL